MHGVRGPITVAQLVAAGLGSQHWICEAKVADSFPCAKRRIGVFGYLFRA